MPMTPKPIRFEEDSLARLDNLAEIEDRDASYLVRQAVDDMLDAHEWQVKQSKEVLAKVESGEMGTRSHSDIKEKFRARRKAV